MKKYPIFILLILSLFACDKREGITVDSAFLRPLLPEPTYKFSRHGRSSVDLLSIKLIDKSLTTLYSSYTKEARLSNQSIFSDFEHYYKEGFYAGYAPYQYIAVSPRFEGVREAIIQDFDAYIKTTKALSGFGKSNTFEIRNTPISKAHSGFIGINIGDDNIAFADEKGLVVAEVFRYGLMGSIYLDQLFNVHTAEATLESKDLRRKHETLEQLQGKNYTALEHHWDLAYGYFTYWAKELQGDGQPLLRDRMQKINATLVQGRLDLFNYDYEALRGKVTIVRSELSRALAVKAMYLLLGVNTLANLQEDAPNAFPFISQAIGMIYALQFTMKADGTPYFTREELKAMIDDLLSGDGLWDTKRLLADQETKGSLYEIAHRLGKPFGISTKDFRPN